MLVSSWSVFSFFLFVTHVSCFDVVFEPLIHNNTNKLVDELKKCTMVLLSSERPVFSLRTEVLQLVSVLERAQTVKFKKVLDLGEGESVTANGVAISPQMAALCAEDYVRTIQFLRGVYDAVLLKQKELGELHPIRVLYAGTGPFALLAIPLMSVFDQQVQFTLIDLHKISVDSATGIILSLGLQSSLNKFECLDAMNYEIDVKRPPHVIVAEVMRAGLSDEPQVSVTRHLMKQAPEAVFIPQEVRLEVGYVDEETNEEVAIGTAFVLNRESVISWGNQTSAVLPGLDVVLPDLFVDFFLFTRIVVYQNHKLSNNESGLTTRLSLNTFVDKNFEVGDRIEFVYHLGKDPQVRGKVQPKIETI